MRGFTLIELMIAVAIVGVLAAIGYPSYESYMKRTRRADAKIALTQFASLQEKFFTICNYYARTLAGSDRTCGSGGSNSGILAAAKAAPTLSPDRHYAITLIEPTGGCPITTCYVLQADPADSAKGGSGRQMGDGSFQINSLGEKWWIKGGKKQKWDK